MRSESCHLLEGREASWKKDHSVEGKHAGSKEGLSDGLGLSMALECTR